MVNKIESLTQAQTALLPKFHAEWLGWGTCTDRADRVRAERAILAMRNRINVENKKPIFIWCDSPATSLMAIHFIKSPEFSSLGNSLGNSLRNSLVDSRVSSLGNSLRNSLWNSLWNSLKNSLVSSLENSLVDSLESSLGNSLRSSLRSSLGNSLESSLRSSLGNSLGNSLVSSLESSLVSGLRNSLVDSLESSLGNSLDNSLVSSLVSSLGNSLADAWWGQHEGYWVAFYLFCQEIGVEYDPQTASDLNLWRDIAQSCCWWWCYENYVVISERPTVVTPDDRRVLHNETGPALAFADGWAVYAWHGTAVPGEWIEDRASLTPKLALSQTNTEQRRAACEILGWNKILAQLGAKTINRDEDPMIGELVEVNLPDAGKERFLRVLCGTGREFAIPVPPGIKTALEANAWTYDIPASLLKLKENRT